MTFVSDMPPLKAPEDTTHPISASLPASGNGNGNGNASPTVVSDMPGLAPSGGAAPASSSVEEVHNRPNSVATLSSPWEFDVSQPYCSSCRDEFSPINRRHHCRLCGKIFCHNCSSQRALIPPSSIVLAPKTGKKARPQPAAAAASFSPDTDPDRMLTYLDQETQQLVYGKGLEERFQLAREPLRVCEPCHRQLLPLQADLQSSNANAMRFNHVDPTDARRLFNSPLAFTLGHEVRKAAYTLNNLLPLPKRIGSVLASVQNQAQFGRDAWLDQPTSELQQCRDECTTVSPNLTGLDGVRIPARLLELAKGVAVLTVAKGGFGLAGVEFGTGLVVARLGGDQRWSAPCAIGAAGMSWGALIGAQVSDHVFLLMTDAAVELMFSNNGSIQLGADIGVAAGPLGRAFEAGLGASNGSFAPIYTYSVSKGLYAGVSLDGKMIVTRHRVNEKFYGRQVDGIDLLSGAIPTPPAAQPLYDALTRCHVYATSQESRRSSATRMPSTDLHDPSVRVYPHSPDMEYGELPESIPVMPPAMNDQHSFAGFSDISTNNY